MPNSINRRRSGGSSDSSAEVAALKEELNRLRQLYIEDMANVSNDMRTLNEQIVQANMNNPGAAPVDDPAVVADPPAEG
jgi:hypothetical protein